MEMAAELPGDIGQGTQRVDVAGLVGAGNVQDGQHPDLLLLGFQAAIAQGVRINPVIRTRGNGDQEVPSQSQDVGGLAQGLVAPV